MSVSTTTSINTSAFDRAFEPLLTLLTVEQAARIADYRCDDQLQERIEELGRKANEGELSDEERAEYEGYARADRIISVLKVKARRFVESRAAT